MHRNDGELEKILEMEAEKSHTSSHYRLQYANREDALRLLIVRERELFEGPGFGEFVYLCSTFWQVGACTVIYGDPIS